MHSQAYRLGALLGVVALLATVLLACGGAPAASPTAAPAAAPTTAPAPAGAPTAAAPAAAKPAGDKVVKIGAIVPLTGPAAKSGEINKTVIDAWVKRVNDAGGINVAGEKHKIQMFMYDDQSANDKARANAERLATVDQVSVVLNTMRSPGAIAIEPVAKKYEIPWFVSGFTPQVNYEGTYVFRVQPSTLMDYYLPLKYIYETSKSRKIGMLSEEGDWGDESMAFVKWWVGQYGGELVNLGRFPFDNKDFRALITKVKAAKQAGQIDVLFTQTWASAGELFLRQARETGLHDILPVFAGTGMGEYVAVDDLGPAMTGLNAVKAYGMVSYTDDPDLVKYVPKAGIDAFAEYKKMGLPVNGTAFTQQGIVVATQAAIEKAGSIDPKKIRQALVGLTVDTVIGPVTFNNGGQPSLPLSLVQYFMKDNKPYVKVLMAEQTPGITELPPKNLPQIKVLQ